LKAEPYAFAFKGGFREPALAEAVYFATADVFAEYMLEHIADLEHNIYVNSGDRGQLGL
jgi:hypothetical protein